MKISKIYTFFTYFAYSLGDTYIFSKTSDLMDYVNDDEIRASYLHARIDDHDLNSITGREQLVVDLKQLLSAYKSDDIALRMISKRADISEKTLRRILYSASSPTQHTIVRFYIYYFSLYSPTNKIHDYIFARIKKITASQDIQLQKKIDLLLRENKVFREIFLYSRCGRITKNWVMRSFGMYGMEMIDLMLRYHLLIEVEKNIYQYTDHPVYKSSTTIKNIMIDLLQDHMRVDSSADLGGKMAGAYLLEGLNEDGKLKILQLMDSFYRDVAAVCDDKSNHGEEKIFVLYAVDKLRSLDEDKNILN